MRIDRKTIESMYMGLAPKIKDELNQAVKLIVEAKKIGGKIIAVVGSGPNIHEGVTTLIAELMNKGIIDGVSTSSAVITHEISGTLEKVKRFNGKAFGFDPEKLPADGQFEVSMLSKSLFEKYRNEIPIDMDLYPRMMETKGRTIIKVAGNMAYPTGLRAEKLSAEILDLAKRYDVPFEQMAGYGADPYTMIGAGAINHIPVLVTVPQLVGGGKVGMAVGDSLSISDRCLRIAKLLDSADVIIESAIALSQEIHDGPFELYTGHGLWTDWENGWTYSLADKKIIRIDLDPNLERAWLKERKLKAVSDAVDKGLPKTKLMQMPFRMEMSGFVRIPGSLPVVGDIGEIWPILATKVADALEIKLDFMSYKQSLPAGKKVREWIVKNVMPVDREKMLARAKKQLKS